VRATDRVGRIGGDEFLIVLPGADAKARNDLSARLRSRMPLELRLSDHERLPISCSIGGASLRGGDSLASLIARADQRMYEAKRRLPSAADGAAVSDPLGG
jgi:diguanylate cyclase (GGDEF)-like protein